MRLLGGNLKGHQLERPKSDRVRPLGDKVRAALFDVVGSVEGQVVLDAYAGSGAAGFEALSRGAIMVEAIEANKTVARIIHSNAQKLGLDWGFVLHQMTVSTWLALPTNQEEPRQRYHLIVSDPPYAQLEPDILEKLGEHLLADGILVVSHSSKTTAPVLESLRLVQHKTYGDSALSFYQRATT